MSENIECNMPFERVPTCACDPGTGPAPRNAEIFRLRTENEKLSDMLKAWDAQIFVASKEIERMRAALLGIQAIAEGGFTIDSAKLAMRCRHALGAVETPSNLTT
jgi:hypothetical protein